MTPVTLPKQRSTRSFRFTNNASAADQVKRWVDSVRENNIPGVVGVMYTTWQRNYNDLKAFSKAVDHYEQESLRRLR